jgi:hypothetical protein
MINPPQVRPEEPTAVTPHGGFCGGKSQQWLRYPTMPHIRFCAGVLSNGHPYRNQPNLMRFFEQLFLRRRLTPVLPRPGSRELKRDRAGS